MIKVTILLLSSLLPVAHAQGTGPQLAGAQGGRVQASAGQVPVWTANVGALSGAASVERGAVVLGEGRQVYRIGAAGEVLWKASLGDMGRAFPIVRPGGSLLVAAYDDRLYALSAAGQPLWNTRLDGDIFASPALLPDGSAAVATAGGSLYRIGAGGEVLWKASLGSPGYSSPAVGQDGHIYLGSQSGRVAAFDQSGKLLWTFQAGRSVFSSPALDAAGNLYFGSADRFLYSLTPQGELRWRQPLGGFVNASPVVTARGQVVVGSFAGELNAYGLDGTPAWSYPAGAAITAPATELWNGDLLVGDLSGVLHRVTAGGQPVSRDDLGDRIDTPVTAADDGTWLVVVDGALRAYAGGWPQAAGPWSSFRSTPQGWGRVPSEGEQAAFAARRSQTAAPLEAALAQAGQPVPTSAQPPQAQAQAPAPAPAAPAASSSPPVPPVATVPAPAATGQPRLIGGRVHLPLPALAAAYGLELRTAPVQEGQGLRAELSRGEQRWSLPAALVGGVPYASIGELGRQPGVRVGTSAQGLNVEWAGQPLLWPLNWVELYANPLPRP
ncbi:outer membrane protein assembly factor BamB family protein [Deinococcus sp. SL84]|uniref:outer membrane protein assembly factor BamB family protein n=1 Tax=Deinococcus sp. SL84 TaxID=2994663 RepID=UPI002273741D|nr:PQQ-binding-like beta-propeller repeat protein [Deinococcus sp. SL84]MCY1701724.1 PQQ-binding-like beta-propeller repeat protein [Deinococcus sp. SL84]